MSSTPIFDGLEANWEKIAGEDGKNLFYSPPTFERIAPSALNDPLLAVETPKVKPEVSARRPRVMTTPAVRADQPDEKTADIKLEELLDQLAGEKTEVMKVPPAAVVTGTHPVVRNDQTRVFQKGELPPPPETGPTGTAIFYPE